MHRISFVLATTLVVALQSGTAFAADLDDLTATQRAFYSWYDALPNEVRAITDQAPGEGPKLVNKAFIDGSCDRFLQSARTLASGGFSHLPAGGPHYRQEVESAWDACDAEAVKRQLTAAKEWDRNNAQRAKEIGEANRDMVARATALQGKVKDKPADVIRGLAGTACDNLSLVDVFSAESDPDQKETLAEKLSQAVTDCSAALSRQMTAYQEALRAKEASDAVNQENRGLVAKALDIQLRMDELAPSSQESLGRTVCGDIELVDEFVETTEPQRKEALLGRLKKAVTDCPGLLDNASGAQPASLGERARAAVDLLEQASKEADTIEEWSGNDRFQGLLATARSEECKGVARFSKSESAGLLLLDEAAVKACATVIQGVREDMKEQLAAREQERQEAEVQVAPQRRSAPAGGGAAARDRLTTYAVIIGRALGCGLNPTQEGERVGAWIDRTWSGSEKGGYLAVFTQGVKQHRDLQLSGRSPDSCDDVRREFRTVRWP